MFTVTDKKQQQNAFASAPKNVGSMQSADRPLDSLDLLQRNLGNGYLQATSQTGLPSCELGIQRSCACSGSCASCMQREDDARKLQTKLVVGSPDDMYEQEADRVANQVMRMPEGVSNTPASHSNQHQEEEEEEEQVQTKPIAPAITPLVQREAKPEEEEEDQTKRLQRESMPEEEEIRTKQLAQPEVRGVTPDLESRIEALRGGGQPLPESERNFFEPRLGVDLSAVRVHTDSLAAQLARSVSARAFTVGQVVAFGSGEYAPGTTEGRRLLAHELTHVVQQRKNASVAGTVNLPTIQRACQYFPEHSDPDTYCESEEEARANITRACPPYRDDFVYRDGPPTHRWRRIPGYGCAHHVAHILGINGPVGARCRGGFAVEISVITAGRTAHPLAEAQINDIWSSGIHSGVVTQVEGAGPHGPRVRVDQCGIWGNAQQVWINNGSVYR